MKAFQNILVATDFGEPAEHALEAAIGFAEKFDAKLTLLHVHTIPTYYGYGEGLYWPIEDLAREARKALDDAVAVAKKRYPRIEAVLASGNPADEILAMAKNRDADLVILGTHGRRGLKHVMLGSVAEKVVRRSPIPVLTVGPRAAKG